MSLNAIKSGFKTLKNNLIKIVIGRDYINDNLHKACSCGDIKLVKYFMEQGGQLNGACFIQACGAGKKDIAELIFNQVIVYPETCINAMVAAIENDHMEIVEWLYTSAGNYTEYSCQIIRSLIKYNRVKTFTRFIDNRNLDSYTGFLFAAYLGSVEFCKILIDKGETRYNDGFIQACGGGNIRTIKFFLKKGANQIAAGILEAWISGHREVFIFLIKIIGRIPSFVDDLSLEELYCLYKVGNVSSVHYRENFDDLKRIDDNTMSSLSGLLIPELSKIIISY